VNQLSKMLCRPFCSRSTLARISLKKLSAVDFKASPEIKLASVVTGLPSRQALA
jgi:hypothetical protein